MMQWAGRGGTMVAMQMTEPVGTRSPDVAP